MKKIMLIVFFVTFLISHSFADMPIEFFKEEVNIELGKNTMTVKGLYFFENVSDFDIDATISYPFSIDSNHQYPTKIKILNPRHPIDFTKMEKGIKWTLNFKPNGINKVSVEYTQRIEENSITYILTNSKLWKRKIDKAMFTIETQKDFAELNISLEPDSIKVKNDKKLHFITKRYFLPKKDLKIVW